ncbi:MAG: hypothetical protein AAGP08_19455, partial [Pseudomonadota bacterium]
STYDNVEVFGAKTLVGFDVFRVEDGLVVEHWDNLQPYVPASETANGNSMVDGATEITDLDKTAENKALVENLINDVLMGKAPEKITEYLSAETYIQHNPQIPNGLDGVMGAFQALAEAGQAFVYTDLHLIVAEGNFVFTASGMGAIVSQCSTTLPPSTRNRSKNAVGCPAQSPSDAVKTKLPSATIRCRSV